MDSNGLTRAQIIDEERQRISSLGGNARAKLPKKQLSAIGRKAAKVRWAAQRKAKK